MTAGDSNIVPLPSLEAIEAEAAEWLTILGRDDIADEDLANFQKWRAASDRHRAVFEELSALWGDLEILKSLDEIAAREPVRRQVNSGRRTMMAMAASVAAVVLAGGAFTAYQATAGLNQSGTYATAVGEQRTIELKDGSVIELNTNSRVDVAYTRGERNLRLVKGEAYFDVAKNPNRPFLVHAGDGVVRAVGTAFTVRLHEANDIEVTVEEGRVALASLAAKTPGAEPRTRKPATEPLAELDAGHRARFAQSVSEVAALPAPELQRKLAWRDGMLAYSGESLADVVADVSRYTDIDIEIADEGLAEQPVAGYFRVGHIEGLFESLELSFGIDVTRVDARHVRLTKSS